MAGGRVYELGRPRADRTTELATASRDDPLPTVSDGGRLSWSSTLTTSLAAVGACALLSAFVGFGVGLKAGSLLPPATTTTGGGALVKSTARSTANAEGRVYRMGAGTEQSVSERRARMEAKLLQEKRIVKAVQSRIANDEIKLDELRKQEVTEELERATFAGEKE